MGSMLGGVRCCYRTQVSSNAVALLRLSNQTEHLQVRKWTSSQWSQPTVCCYSYDWHRGKAATTELDGSVNDEPNRIVRMRRCGHEPNVGMSEGRNPIDSDRNGWSQPYNWLSEEPVRKTGSKEDRLINFQSEICISRTFASCFETV